MQLSKERINVEMFNISLENDHETGVNELETFAEVIKKCNTESKKSGFKKVFNGTERSLIEGIYKILFKEDGSPQISKIDGGLTNIVNYEDE